MFPCPSADINEEEREELLILCNDLEGASACSIAAAKEEGGGSRARHRPAQA